MWHSLLYGYGRAKMCKHYGNCVWGYISVASQIKSFWIPKWHFILKAFPNINNRICKFWDFLNFFAVQTPNNGFETDPPQNLICCLSEQNQVVTFIPHVFINANASCLFKTVLYRHTPSALLGSFSLCACGTKQKHPSNALATFELRMRH